MFSYKEQQNMIINIIKALNDSLTSCMNV